jgi:capsular polysaccharide biosynthesis protein
MEQHRFRQVVDQFEEGLSLDQIASFAKRHFVLILCCVVLGIAISIGVALVMPKEWDATNTLQVGQVARSTGDSNFAIEPIEAPARTVERLMLPQFQDDVLRMLGLPMERSESRVTALVRDHVVIGLVRNTDLISISARGYSQDEARRIVDAYETRLIETHKALLQPSLDHAVSELAQAKGSIVLLQQRREQLESLSAQKSVNDDRNFSQNVLLGNLLQQNDSDIRRFQAQVQDLQEAMDPARTFNTRPLINVIAVSDKPIFPKKSVFAALGALIGLVIGAGIGLLGDRRSAR